MSRESEAERAKRQTQGQERNTRRNKARADRQEQYKCHVLPLMESASGAIYHAASSILDPLDRAQSSFLHTLGVEPPEAFTSYNLAPFVLPSRCGDARSFAQVRNRSSASIVHVFVPIVGCHTTHSQHTLTAATSRQAAY
jgi:hypothetical protein